MSESEPVSDAEAELSDVPEEEAPPVPRAEGKAKRKRVGFARQAYYCPYIRSSGEGKGFPCGVPVIPNDQNRGLCYDHYMLQEQHRREHKREEKRKQTQDWAKEAIAELMSAMPIGQEEKAPEKEEAPDEPAEPIIPPASSPVPIPAPAAITRTRRVARAPLDVKAGDEQCCIC